MDQIDDRQTHEASTGALAKPKELWAAPELREIDIEEVTLAGGVNAADGNGFS